MNWLADVFRPLERFESLLVDFYSKLGERFAPDAEAAQLFVSLARGSKSCKSQIEFLHKLAKTIEKALPETALDTARIAREVEALERVRGMVDAIGLDAAVGMALQFECGGAKHVFHRQLGEAHPDLAQMIKGFGLRRDAAHPSMLLKLATRREFALPAAVTAAAKAAIAEARSTAEQAAFQDEAARQTAAEEEARRTAEVAELEAAIKAGKTAIDLRIEKQRQRT